MNTLTQEPQSAQGWRPLLALLTGAALFSLLVWRIAGIRFESNDDMGMMAIAQGVLPSTPPWELINVHPAYGELVYGLQQAFPSINAYLVLELFLLEAGLVCAAWALTAICGGAKGWVAAVAWYFGLGGTFLCWPQYTACAGLLGLAATLMAAASVTIGHRKGLLLVLASLLMLAGMLLRAKMAVVTLLISALGVASLLSPRGVVRPLSTLIFLCLLSWPALNVLSGWMRPDAEAWREYNRFISAFDWLGNYYYGLWSAQTAPLYRKAGLSPNDAQLILQFVWADPALNAGALEKTVTGLFEAGLVYPKWFMLKPLVQSFLSPFGAGAWGLFLLGVIIQKGKVRVGLILGGGLALAVLTAFSLLGRLPQRVQLPVMSAVFILGLLAVFTTSFNHRVARGLAWTCTLLVLGHLYPALRFLKNLDGGRRETAISVLNALPAKKGVQTILWPGAVPVEFLPVWEGLTPWKNKGLILLGWYLNAPSATGPYPLTEALATQKNLYFVSHEDGIHLLNTLMPERRAGAACFQKLKPLPPGAGPDATLFLWKSVPLRQRSKNRICWQRPADTNSLYSK